MLEFIKDYIPDWVIRCALGIFVWYGVCYFIVSPFIYGRVTLPLKKSYILEIDEFNKYYGNSYHYSKAETRISYGECLYSKFYETHSFEVALWVASAGFIRSTSILRMPELINNLSFKESCGAKPWKRSWDI